MKYHYRFFLVNKTNRRTNFPNLFCHENLHVSGSCSAHYQEFLTYIRHWYMSWRFDDNFQARPGRPWKLDGQRNCRKVVEFLDKINLGTNYRRLQILQSKCLIVIGNHLRRTPNPPLHSALNIAPIRDFIYHLTDNIFGSCPVHPNHLNRSIGNYTLTDLHRQYKKYINKRPKHLFLSLFTQLPQCFSFVPVFHCYTYNYLTR